MGVNEPADLLTVPEAARRLRLHRVSVYRAVQRGELQAFRVGTNGPLRISRAALDEYLRPAARL